MLLNAEKIFDGNADEFYAAVGEPKCAEDFHRKHIIPAGDAADAEYGYVIGQYQRSSFVVGFRAATQLFMGCMADGKTKE